MKMEIELTDDQAEKVETLKENDISVGEAIDMLFELKESINQQSSLYIDMRVKKANEKKAKLEAEMAEVDRELSLFEKIKDSSVDIAEKQKMVEREYSTTYDEAIPDTRHKFKWSKSIFKF